MPKFDALSLQPHEAPPETREFTDPGQPGVVLAVTMKRPEFPDYALAQEISQVLVERWIEPPDGKPPPRWPPPPAEPIRWSKRLCQVLALVEALQRPADPADAYDADELAVISVRMPKAWEQVAAWVQELEAVAPPGNA